MDDTIFGKKILAKIKNAASQYVRETELKAQLGTIQSNQIKLFMGNNFQVKTTTPGVLSSSELEKLVKTIETRKKHQAELSRNRISNYSKHIGFSRLLKYLNEKCAAPS